MVLQATIKLSNTCTRHSFSYHIKKHTVKREYLAAIIFGVFLNITIWQRINLAISNTGIYKDADVFIWRRLILANLSNSPISPNKSLPIINCFTVSETYLKHI